MLEELGDPGGWSRAGAGRWWRERAPEVRAAVRSRHSGSSTPGPRTVAIDLERRQAS